MTLEPDAVKAVVLAALDRTDPAERAAYVAEACAGDESLRRRVEQLLRSHEAPGPFLGPPVEPPGDETGPYRRDPAETVGPAESAAAAPATPPPGAGNRVARHAPPEIPALLRYRLRVLALMAFGLALLFFALNFSRHPLDTRTVWLVYAPGGVFLAATAVGAALVWRPDALSLRRLRASEVVLFAVIVTYVAWVHYHTLFLTNAWFLRPGLQQPTEITLLARHPSLTWLVIIVCYGTFIPNTGRRCAAVTVSMAMVPLTLTAVGGFSRPEIPPRLVVICLTEMFMFMATAVAMAIFGSHKINALRQEALEARKLGPYQLKRRLGAGGMGEVYLAEHVLLRRPCAVKLIRPERAGDPDVLRRFLREVQVTATLTHPNTVQVFDYGQTEDGTLYYAMEYLPGLTLDEMVRHDGPLPPGRAVFLLRQLCGALAEAHAVGLIHRDLKPGNVILGARGGLGDVAKLLDFGLVHRPVTDGGETRLTHAGLVFGTPAYMSPEQAAGRLDLDARSDIYSLGALAYYLLTGRPPFVRPTLVQTVTAHLTDPPPPPSEVRPDIPADLAAVVVSCLEKRAECRPASTAELERRLGACACAGEWSAAAGTAWWGERPTGSAANA
jgi:serine/threonine-protein kinase